MQVKLEKMQAEEAARPGDWRGSSAGERPCRSALSQETKSEPRRGHCGKNVCREKTKLILCDVKS